MEDKVTKLEGSGTRVAGGPSTESRAPGSAPALTLSSWPARRLNMSPLPLAVFQITHVRLIGDGATIKIYDVPFVSNGPDSVVTEVRSQHAPDAFEAVKSHEPSIGPAEGPPLSQIDTETSPS